MIEAKIIIEIPLPMPCSVMSSPSHMRIMDPAVMAVTESAQSPKDGVKSVARLAFNVD